MVDLALVGKHYIIYLAKRAATTDRCGYQFDQIFVCRRLFSVPIAIVLLCCAINILTPKNFDFCLIMECALKFWLYIYIYIWFS